ncbi:hypothetical protein CC86DRAFT_411643 [Ophiobolus disseminans]|uniref:Uncharacterized protein n=1 Tax=Ophiobolus disseminans TaxID=1469910 RepID=A0A6A6ZKE9_9PLEO|nr:hypothetical protein CC86DRAFT_411643 [Ophiobolus disseminans]
MSLIKQRDATIILNNYTIGRRKNGGLVIHDEGGILVINADLELDEIKEILQALAHTH